MKTHFGVLTVRPIRKLGGAIDWYCVRWCRSRKRHAETVGLVRAANGLKPISTDGWGNLRGLRRKTQLTTVPAPYLIPKNPLQQRSPPSIRPVDSHAENPANASFTSAELGRAVFGRQLCHIQRKMSISLKTESAGRGQLAALACLDGLDMQYCDPDNLASYRRSTTPTR